MSVFVSLLLMVRSLVRTRVALQIEVLALQHQLNVLQRSRPHRLRLTPVNRFFWVWLSRAWTEWRAAHGRGFGVAQWPPQQLRYGHGHDDHGRHNQHH